MPAVLTVDLHEAFEFGILLKIKLIKKLRRSRIKMKLKKLRRSQTKLKIKKLRQLLPRMIINTNITMRRKKTKILYLKYQNKPLVLRIRMKLRKI